VGPIFLLSALLAMYAISSLRILRQWELGVTFFLGKYWGTKGPGLVFVPRILMRMQPVSLRMMAMDIPPQDVITRDNVSIKVNAVMYMRVKIPEHALIKIENYIYATSQLAQTTLRSVLGEVQLDELLADREKINAILKKIVDQRTEEWGIEVAAIEVKDVDLPPEMKRAMARQAEAERERRAKVIAAEGEFQASGKLAEAANVIAGAPGALQLRYLQTMAEISSEGKSSVIVPLPMDLFAPFIKAAQVYGEGTKPLPPPNTTGTPLLKASLPEKA
jgi:regulator of protease activity HflC (stomatin/prohibitin superfamily)